MLGMDLKTWVESMRGRASDLAEHLHVPASFVSKMVSGEKHIPIAHMAAIEAFTERAVTRQEMCPADWQKIWPELAAAPSQPHAAPAPSADTTDDSSQPVLVLDYHETRKAV